MFSKIVVALDGSQCSDQALEVVLKLAQSENAQVAVCSVVDPTGPLWPPNLAPQ